MTTDASKGTVSFKLREPGFLRNYEVGADLRQGAHAGAA